MVRPTSRTIVGRRSGILLCNTSIDEDVLESILLLLEEENDNNTKVVAIPIIDVGMAHGEKARGGALF